MEGHGMFYAPLWVFLCLILSAIAFYSPRGVVGEGGAAGMEKTSSPQQRPQLNFHGSGATKHMNGGPAEIFMPALKGRRKVLLCVYT